MTEIAVPRSAIRRIFLSSTFIDLQTHRVAVHDIIERMGHFTIGMERFGAQDGDAQSVSLDQLAAADLYIGIIAWRYGFIPPHQPFCVTQQEYQEATRLGLPRYLFLADASTQADESLTALFPAHVRDPDHLPQLLAFREQIKRERVVDFFTTPDDLAKKVGAALHDYLLAHPVSTQQVPHDLPPRAPGFVGHDQDVANISAQVRQGQAVAIVGMGGLGKSSVAAEVAHALTAEPGAFPGGVAWVRCDDRIGIEGLIWIEDQLLAAWSASLPAEATARAATPEEGFALRERTLQKRLRPETAAEPTPALVLFDNVESGLPLDRLLALVQPLGVTSLLTMRSEPGSPRVHLLRLEALSTESAGQLFRERYIGRGGQWEAPRDQEAAQAIVTALGHLPLAIELAAARAARIDLPLLALAEELHMPDTLARLSDPLEPSASVRYSLARTLAVLPTALRARFAALGLPEGADWPAPVIERMLAAVAADPADPAAPVVPEPRAIEMLAAYSLVGFSSGAGGQRLRLHPLVRELAHEEWARQPEAEQHTVLAGLLAGVSAWVSQWSRDYDLLAHDADLIAGSFRAACRQRVELPTAFALLAAFDSYLLTRDFPLRKEMCLLQLETARAVGDRAAELDALLGVMGSAYWLGQTDEVMGDVRQALDVARELRNPEATARMLSMVAKDAIERGDLAEARRLFDEARPLARTFAVQTAAEQAVAANAFLFLGEMAAALGQVAEAREWYLQAQALARSAEDDFQLALANYHLVDLAARMGDGATARSYFEQRVATVQATHNALGLGSYLDRLGEIALQTGDLTTAAQCFQEAEQALASIEHAQLLAHVRGNLAALQGEIARARGDTAEAAHDYGEALEFFAQDQGRAPFHHVWSRGYADWVAERLATLSQPVSASQTGAALPTPGAADAAVPSTRRRWWPWGR